MCAKTAPYITQSTYITNKPPSICTRYKRPSSVLVKTPSVKSSTAVSPPLLSCPKGLQQENQPPRKDLQQKDLQQE